MEFREVMSWWPDRMPETTKAVVLVSSDGSTVKRLPHRRWNDRNKGYSDMLEHVYLQSQNRGKGKKDMQTNYYCVYINGKTHNVHRLVALAFIPNPMEKEQVNHINGIKTDNRIENLEWATNKENALHANNTGLRDHVYESSRKVSKKDIEEMIKLRKKGIDMIEISKIFGVTNETVRFLTCKNSDIGRMRKPKVTYAQKKQAIEMRNNGMTLKAIGDFFGGYNEGCVSKWVRDIVS